MDTKDISGVSFEKVVARIQQMMDTNSVVTHNENLVDRVGNTRQFDVVIRGQFGGRPVLGVIECKDHSRKKGPDTIEAFAKKSENLGANLRLIVSKKGFTEQALNLAKHEHIGCLSLLPQDPKQLGFSIGNMFYGVIKTWEDLKMELHFAVSPCPFKTFDIDTVKWKDKAVINWFWKELFTTYCDTNEETTHVLELLFDKPQDFEIEGQEFALIGITCYANRIIKKKKQWFSWSGDAFWDWHTNQLSVPIQGKLTGSKVSTDLSTWEDYDGEMLSTHGIADVILYETQTWDSSKDEEVPDLSYIL
jgi:hypothetical protein